MTGSLLAEALAGDAGRPFVTFYDDGTGERVELSVATLANWVAKTANLLVDGLAVEPGDSIRLDLPRHWQLPVWGLAAWTTGLVLDLDGDPAGCRLAVCGPDGIGAARAADEVVALSLRPLGAPFGPDDLPSGVLDYGREVAGYGDRFVGAAVDPGAPAIRFEGTSLTLAAARSRAEDLASSWSLGPGGRLHVYVPLDPLSEVLASTLVPLSVGGSVVLSRPVARPGEGAVDMLSARAGAERTTAVAL
jgi:uncharacterized protein (TIGR03089 family)